MVKPVLPHVTYPPITIARGLFAATSTVIAVKTANAVRKTYNQQLIDAANTGGIVRPSQTMLADATYGLACFSGRGCQLWAAMSVVEGLIDTTQLMGSIFGMGSKKVKFLNNALSWIMPKSDYLYMGVLGGSALTVITGAVAALNNCTGSSNRRHAE